MGVTPSVIYAYDAPLMAEGFQSWTAPVAMTSVALICAFRARKMLARTGLVLAAWIAAVF